MRDLLDRYIRSLREQEQAREAPEYRQDLGTFVDWLLVRQGYRVLERTFRHEGPERRKATGERQWGADILATKTDADGALHGYRFVLKQGHVGNSQWRNEDGFLPHDLWLAAGRRPDDIKKHRPGEEIPCWTVVAVHNGDFRAEQVGPQRQTLMEQIPHQTRVDVDWWDVNRLVELALEAPAVEDGHNLMERADPGLFPPGIRPFARLAIDSLAHGTAGGRFDLEAVDRLIDAVLPKEETINTSRWERSVAELGLLAAMVDVDCRWRPEVRDSTLPALETNERILCRAMHHVVSWDSDTKTKAQEDAGDLLRLLLKQYVGIASRLLEHLATVLPLERGLTIASLSERIDYPLRCLRLAGYLAAAGAAALDLGNRAAAERFADGLQQLFTNNPGGALSPVIDDQLVELALAWNLWRRLGKDEVVRDTARALVTRLLLRRNFGLPLPALWLEASVPLDERAVRILVEAQFRRHAPGFQDGGSLILPLALYLGWRDAAAEEADPVLAAFSPRDVPEPRRMVEDKAEDDISLPRVIHTQSWLPPDDAPRRWYAEALSPRGTAHVFRVGVRFSEFVVEFERFNRPLPTPSPAEQLHLGSIDCLAWKRFRNPPPMALFIERTAKLSGTRPPARQRHSHDST
jgi:hypothetical protein